MLSSDLIYHITSKIEWEAALINGSYEAPSLASEGFIHCSTYTQVDGVLERYYKNQTDLVKLVINPSLLTAPLKLEWAPSVNEQFPHIYGPLNIEAVQQVIDL